MAKTSKTDSERLMYFFSDGDRYRTSATGLRKFLIRFLLIAAAIFGLIILPFFLLVRTSVYLTLDHGFNAWAALGGGVLATILLLLTYLLYLFRKVRNKRLLVKLSLAGASTMVLGFCMFSLLYLSAENAKSPQVRELYSSMHPVLRVAVSTVTLADGHLIITDIERQPVDYRNMGLPVNPNSRHYRQESGYVQAVDLRTRGRGTIRNTLLKFSLELMGFRTLRHVGTADHLHVELG